MAALFGVRLVQEEDVKPMLEIYGPVVENTAVSFEYLVPSHQEFWTRITNNLKTRPWLVCEIDGMIAGYGYRDFVAYYLLTMITRAFSSMPGLSSGIARQIRDGEIKKFLIQPIDLVGFLFLSRIAHKLVYYIVAALPFGLVFFLCRDFFDNPPDALTWCAYLASLLMAFLLGFFLEATIGMIGFWFLEVSSLLFVYMLFNFFCSGHMFPLDMLPEPWLSLVRFLPLQYLAYFPAAVFLGKIQDWALIEGLLLQLGWVLFFMAACRVGLHFGLKRYSGFGG